MSSRCKPKAQGKRIKIPLKPYPENFDGCEIRYFVCPNTGQIIIARKNKNTASCPCGLGNPKIPRNMFEPITASFNFNFDYRIVEHFVKFLQESTREEYEVSQVISS